MRRKKFGTLSEIQNFREDAPKPEKQNAPKKEEQEPPVAAHNMRPDSKQAILPETTGLPAAAHKEGNPDPKDATSGISNSDVKLTRRTPQPKPLQEARITIGVSTRETPRKRAEHVVIEFDKKDKSSEATSVSLLPKQGELGAYFSVHSNINERIVRSYELTELSSKSCLCCAHRVAATKERWNPYKPGDNATES